MRRFVSAWLLLLATAAAASEAQLGGTDGHPRDRFPLTLHLASFGDASLDAVAAQAVDDWNRTARRAIGVNVFRRVGDTDAAVVSVVTLPPDPRGLMGFAEVQSGADGVITLPVRVVVHEPRARGETTRETILYQVLAHELGHALGLVHTTDPRSLMCCIHASLDFKDAAVRAAYLESRRRPEVGTAAAQLAAHYERFWRTSR